MKHPDNYSKISSAYTNTCVTPAPKGKAIPLQAWTDPGVSRRLSLPDFKTIGT